MKKAMAACLLLSAVALPALAQMPAMPQPGPEHEMLKKDVGTWDATVESFMAPGAPATVSKGTETVTMMGGFWQLTEFKSEMMGQPFEGRGTTGYDPAKKKFVGTWVDTMTPSYYTVEATYDAAKRTMSTVMEGPDPSGQVGRTKATTEWKDADNRVFTMYGPDGQTVMMRITYKRRK
ncbi:MAG TPA: DUF1579 domain-containing protein [Vicinamibacteria bacterium]|nr:DUF1579 domain-containing protein [Vicinamibacteria bacterium]